MKNSSKQPRKENKLDAIFEEKRKELDLLKKQVPLEELKRNVETTPHNIRNFKNALENNPMMSLIAEIKKASPSAGDINAGIDIKEQAKKYESAGANAISILTDSRFKGQI